ncbi:hypothetical protein LTR36_005640 [Oleoguttula mirabilis]|uniref:SprT-like domain-containing protein n=1 Tax=Oleoguttula mirabilis TaxID=1507867 RepID=A0AAV9JDD3_9PEZI|nr:hypothetical protein LTR36_005640 [Oleoguttula mirabilis]
MFFSDRSLSGHAPPKPPRKRKHDSIELVQSALKYINRTRWLWIGTRGVSYWLWKNDWLKAELKSHMDQERLIGPNELTGTMEILDRLFFGGLLHPHVLVQWRSDMGDQVGITTFDSDDNGNALISLSPKRAALAGQTPTQAIISNLLHEMCHAYILIYACFGECERPQCKKPHPTYIQKIGAKGHGRAWQMLAAAVEARANKVLGIRVDLERVTAAWTEYQKSGVWPSNGDVQRLFGGVAPRDQEVLPATVWFDLS